MYTTFHINTNDLDINFIKGLKAMFRNKNVSIIVEEDMDETEYLLSSESNRIMLEESIKQAESGNLVKVKIGKL